MHPSSPTRLATLAVALVAPALAQACTTQGAGSCNFQLTGSFELGKDWNWNVQWDTAEVFDYECNSIGVAHPTHADGSSKPAFEEGDVVTSQLPYTVIISHIGGSHGGVQFDKLGLQYADYDSGWIPWVCSTTEGDNPRHSCIHAFPCA